MKRLLMGVAMLSAVVVMRAENQQWSLADGRTVTVIKVLSQNATHVTVRSAEGIQQIDKRQLPEELKAQYPYDDAAAEAKLQAEEAEKLQAARAAERQGAPERQRQAKPQERTGGLAILEVRATERATAVVTVANRTASLVEVTREMFAGVNINGAAFPAVRMRNARGDIFVRLRVPAGETKEITVLFAIPEDEVGDIRTVGWRQQ